MRKPLVVVCLTTSAVLLAGGIAAATTAGAETTPDSPVVALPDMSALPELPGGPGAAPSGPAMQVPSMDVTPPDTTGADPVPDRPSIAQPDRPDQQQPATQRPAQDRPAQDRPAQDRPAQERPAQEPAPQRPADSAAGAQQDVSPASVSGSPSAPVQQQVLALANENRRRGGCDGLTLDRRLIAAANRHAADMARHGYFAHRSLDGRGTDDRVSDAGYEWSRYGENIARGQDSPAEVMDGWMNSPEHRENIMDCRFTQMGVGLAFDAGDRPYWVQDFATPQ